MTKQVIYTYLGTNGVLTTPIHLEDIYYTRSILLRADKGMSLTKDEKSYCFSVRVPEEEVDEWMEVPTPPGQL